MDLCIYNHNKHGSACSFRRRYDKMIDIKEERLKNLSDYNIPNAGLSDKEIKQILQDHEIGKKYDDLMKANSEIVQHNIDITKHSMIIKRLEEILQERKIGEDDEMLSKIRKILEERNDRD